MKSQEYPQYLELSKKGITIIDVNEIKKRKLDSKSKTSNLNSLYYQGMNQNQTSFHSTSGIKLFKPHVEALKI